MRRGGGMTMIRTVAIGTQSFEKIISSNCFYVDKTAFIKAWGKVKMRWLSGVF